jgi:hypothetical protein
VPSAIGNSYLTNTLLASLFHLGLPSLPSLNALSFQVGDCNVVVSTTCSVYVYVSSSCGTECSDTITLSTSCSLVSPDSYAIFASSHLYMCTHSKTIYQQF